jgi:spermidine/putrescine transport system substrate-binding protein
MRHLSIVLMLLMLFVLAACGGNPTPAATEEETEAVVTEEATNTVVTEEATEVEMEATDEATEAAAETPAEENGTEEAIAPEATEAPMESTDEAAVEGTQEVAAEGTEAASVVDAWVCPEGYAGQELNVYNWSTYIAEDTIPNFEAACGVTVTYDTFENNEAVLTRLQQGNPGYDIIVPTDYMIATMIREELLIPLDKSKIPNMVNLNPNLLDQAYDPGNVYSVPYQWGTIGIGYNTTKFPEGIDSWTDLWAYEGPVAWLDDRRGFMGVALQILGYDPNSVTEAEIVEAKEYLIANGGNVTNVAGDDGQELLARGDVDAAVEYNGDILALAAENPEFAYVVPAEAAVLWVDNLAVPVGAANPDLAMVFIDYILHPQVAADISNYTAYASPNQTALDLGLILEAGNPGIYPSAETQANLFSIKEVPADVEAFYNDAWDELLVSLGSN